MAFKLIDQGRVANRPSGEVRIATCRNATVTLLTVFCGEDTMTRAGFKLGDSVQLLRGEDDDAGWIRMEKCEPIASARILGKMPGTAGGAARFRTPKDWALPMISSTGVPEDEFRVEPGAVTVRLPPLLRGVVVEGDQLRSMHGKQPDIRDSASDMHDKAPVPKRLDSGAAQSTRLHYRTEARSAMLRRFWPMPGMSVPEIREQMNALEGPEIPDTKSVLYHWAESLGLPTARSSQPGFPTQASTVIAPAGERVASATPARSSTNGIESRASLSTVHPDKADAVLLLEAGKSARYVAEEFGLPIGTVATWAAEVRARQQAERAA